MQAEATAAKPRPAAKRVRCKLKKTATPGVYKKGNRYVVMYWAAGEQHKESCATYDEARRLKRARETDDDRGEFQAQQRVTLHEYAREWIDRYQGNGRRGFRENTRDEYRRLLDTYALHYFPKTLKLTDVSLMHLARYVAWLASDTQKRPLPAPRSATASSRSGHTLERGARGVAAPQPRDRFRAPPPRADRR
jgi:hypothetical protein